VTRKGRTRERHHRHDTGRRERPWCGDCARARAWLDAHHIAYTEVDVEADPGARERAAAHNEGRLHTPTFEIGDGVCVDFRPDTLSDLLGIK